MTEFVTKLDLAADMVIVYVAWVGFVFQTAHWAKRRIIRNANRKIAELKRSP